MRRHTRQLREMRAKMYDVSRGLLDVVSCDIFLFFVVASFCAVSGL